MKRFRLTFAARVLITILVIALGFGGVFGVIRSGKVSFPSFNGSSSSSELDTDADGNIINTSKDDDATINLSLDEWIGWKSIIDANGGLSTQEGSIYDKLGIDVNISIINDATQSSNALISGSLDAAGYTINRTAFLSEKFKEAEFGVVMPYITNFSNGGDGIIANSNITSVNDLVNAKVGVPQFSEAHSLVVWFVNQSDLNDSDKQKIIDNLIFFDTADDAAKAFFAGEIDVAATWEPYLTQAQNMSDAHILFSTASSSSLIMDGILFSEDFANQYPDVVSAFIDGSLEAAEMYDTEMNTIKKVMPMFSTASDNDIVENCASAKLTTYADNISLMNGTAKTIYSDMCNVWESIGESVNNELVNTLFDSSYIESLSGKYDENDITRTETVTVTDENKEEIIDAASLLKKSVSINFISDTAKFLDSAKASQQLDDFISIANVLDGAIIQVEGNVASDVSNEVGVALSKSRADTVKNYLVLNGISADRIITVGNGGSKPIASNDTEDGKAKNRRTDISFKCIEG